MTFPLPCLYSWVLLLGSKRLQSGQLSNGVPAVFFGIILSRLLLTALTLANFWLTHRRVPPSYSLGWKKIRVPGYGYI